MTTAATNLDLHRLLASGETDTVEFRSLPRHSDLQQQLAKSIIAFANTRGGTILIGVTHHGHVVGATGDDVEALLASLVRERATPPVTVHITRHTLEEKPVYAIHVPASTTRPHRLASNQLAYIRSGKSDRPATGRELGDMPPPQPIAAGASMDRTAVIATASTYIMSGLIHQKPEGVKLAPTCYRGENGWETGKDASVIAENLRNSKSKATVRGVRNMRWVVQGGEAVCLFEYHMTTGNLHVIEYFRVAAGLIQEIRPNAGGLERPVGYGEPTAAKPMTKMTGVLPRQAALCQPFLAGLESHNLAQTPFSYDVSLLENGKPLIYGPEAVRAWATTGIAAETKRITVQRWVVEGNEAVVIFELDRADGRTYWCSLYFRLYDDHIRELQFTTGLAPARG